jgi:glycosyltransferase involved in cell wall biosynthesis
MCLSHYYLGIEADYKIGDHLDTFNDLGELVEKCKHYLKNEEHRAVIANAGYHHAHNNFTFDNMAKEIINLYNKYKK